jgi:hypothetical protein
MERSRETREGENIRGLRRSTLLFLYYFAIDPRYKHSNYVKMATMVMSDDKKGEKLWAMMNTYFHAIFEEYREIYAPNNEAPQPADI